MGRPCRGASHPLIARQYWEEDSFVHESLELSLRFLLKVLKVLKPREVKVLSDRAPLLIYTDASTDAPCPSGLRLGVVITEQDSTFVPICASFDVPADVVRSGRLDRPPSKCKHPGLDENAGCRLEALLTYSMFIETLNLSLVLTNLYIIWLKVKNTSLAIAWTELANILCFI